MPAMPFRFLDAIRGLCGVLDDWCEPFPGYHLYYPSRHLHSAVFTVLVEHFATDEAGG
jgi:DNA-binding transcriptional LysR family regulator